jgi:hypothetical protein
MCRFPHGVSVLALHVATNRLPHDRANNDYSLGDTLTVTMHIITSNNNNNTLNHQHVLIQVEIGTIRFLDPQNIYFDTKTKLIALLDPEILPIINFSW